MLRRASESPRLGSLGSLEKSLWTTRLWSRSVGNLRWTDASEGHHPTPICGKSKVVLRVSVVDTGPYSQLSVF